MTALSPPAPRPHAAGRVGRTAFDRCLTVGLVNNMPDAALRSTERQFLRLLACPDRDMDVRVRLFYLPQIQRGEEARAHLHRHYAPADDLIGSEIDALIVTGSEPRQPDLMDEPYWQDLARLVDWARHNTLSTYWSCLAAHAAVRHLDGIERQRLPTKLSGVYGLARVVDHPLLLGAGPTITVPHSRHNGLPARELARHGYELLTHSEEVGADLFVKSWPSLFLFVQGHPEYDGDSLLREYRRDMGRFLAGERETCPPMPQGYLDPEAERLMDSFAEQARMQPRPELLSDFPHIEARPRSYADWHTSAARLFGNWLRYVARTKDQRFGYAGPAVSSPRELDAGNS